MIMRGPGWITGILAAVMLTVAVYCAGRLIVARRTGRPTEVDADGAHVFMGVAMAGMLAAGLKFLPNGVWEAVFAGGAVWFACRYLQTRRPAAAASPWRCPHPLPHLVECGAMLYMLAVVVTVAARSSGSGMAAMAVSATASRFSIVALALAVFLLGYAVWVGDRLTGTRPALALAPAVPAGTMNAAVSSAAAPRAAATPDQATPDQPAGQSSVHACQPYLAPRCAALCKIAMGVTMGYMLIMLL
jgi:hypothetical protein